MKVNIEKMDNQGRGICYELGKVGFVSNTLPGEIVDIEILNDKKKFFEGMVKEYIKKSEKRLIPECSYFGICGGCDLLHISYEEQLQYKQNKIDDIIYKFTKMNINIKPIIPSEEKKYRNKITLHNNGKLGYYINKTNNVIGINKCLIADENINKIINQLNKLKLDNIYEIIIRSSKKIQENMIILKINDVIDNNYYINNLKDYVDTIVIYEEKKYKAIYGKGYIYDKLGDYKFKISPSSFFQVNTIQAEKLYDKVLEYLNPDGSERVLDLYCGTGTIGIYISKYVKEVYGVELNKAAIEDAFENKNINNIDNINFECLDASLVKKINKKFDSIIVDPPRSGLDTNTLKYLLSSNTKKIVYVSCDPITLARDLKLLNERYNVIELTPVDMFPNTYHCESVCVLERR